MLGAKMLRPGMVVGPRRRLRICFSWSLSRRASSPIRQGRYVKANSLGPWHHRRFFIGGLLVICSPHRRQADRAGRRTFCAFGKQLATLFAKILAIQAIILAFLRDNTYVLAYRVTAERIGLAANSVPD